MSHINIAGNIFCTVRSGAISDTTNWAIVMPHLVYFFLIVCVIALLLITFYFDLMVINYACLNWSSNYATKYSPSSLWNNRLIIMFAHWLCTLTAGGGRRHELLCKSKFKYYCIIFTDRQTDWETDRQTDRETDRQTDRQLYRQTDR